MKKKYFNFLILFLICCMGLFFRLFNLDKMSGLWHDEITIYSIASKSIVSGMINADCQRFLLFPLYYIFYHLWIHILGNSDFVIRLMSVFFDSLSIICAFFVGKELSTILKKEEFAEKFGIFASLIFSINSLCIYYAQEAKFYSISLFFINLMILFWLKFLKNQSFKNTFFFILFNFLILYSYTSQIVLLFIIQILTFFYFLKKKINLQNFLKEFCCFLIVLLPLFLILFSYKGNYFSGNFDAVAYDNSFFLLLFQNFFSPILQGLQNNILSYEFVLLLHVFDIFWWIFIFFPILFFLFAIQKSFKKNTISKLFVSVFLIYFFIHSLLSTYTNYAVLVRYMIPTLPFLLYPAVDGFIEITKNKKGAVLFSLFILINIYILFSPISANKISRPDNYRELASILIKNKISQNDDFVLPFREDLLDKYFLVKGEKYTLYKMNSDTYKNIYLTKDEKFEKNQKKSLKRFLKAEQISPKLKVKILSDYTQKMKNNDNLVYIKDCGICLLNENKIKQVVSNEKFYQNAPLQFLKMSKYSDIFISVLSEKMILKEKIKYKGWEIYVFKKKSF